VKPPEAWLFHEWIHTLEYGLSLSKVRGK